MPGSVMMFAQFLDRLQLCDGLRQFRLGLGVFHRPAPVGHGLFGLPLGFQSTRLVQVGTADGSFVFSTTGALSIPPGASSGLIQAGSTAAGSAAKGHLPGSFKPLTPPTRDHVWLSRGVAYTTNKIRT